MKDLAKKLHSEAGFTLVELLIVIVIIGILAVAVLAAINPMEQFRRARDASMTSAAREISEGADRYIAINGTLPVVTSVADLVDDLRTAGELKAESLGGLDLTSLSITAGTTDYVQICFTPTSIKFIGEVGAGVDYCVPRD